MYRSNGRQPGTPTLVLQALPFPHRFSAALRAISLRRFGESAAALAFPPFDPPSFPRATAAGFFFRAGGVCPVASATTRKAAWATSSFFLGRLGIMLKLSNMEASRKTKLTHYLTMGSVLFSL
jgi:hypothetical protein